MNPFSINLDDVRSLKAELEHQYPEELIIPAQLQVLHPLLKNVKIRLDDYAKRYKNQLISASRDQVDVSVSPKNVSKALRFVNTFLKFAEKRNHRVVVYDKRTCLVVQGEEIQFKFRERASRSDTPTKYGLYELIPTGVLYFKIETYTWSREFTNEKAPLEDQLSNIMAYLEVKGKLMFEQTQRWKVTREQDERKRQLELEAKQRLEDELKAFKKLHSQASRWKGAMMIREYVAEVEKHFAYTDTMTEESMQWIEWAKRKADWYDPILRIPDELLQGFDPDKI